MEPYEIEIIDTLFGEFEQRTFTAENVSIFCGISTEMLEQLVEDRIIEQVEGGYRLLPYKPE